MRGQPHLDSETGRRTFLALRKVASANRRNPDAVATRFVLERVVARIFAGPHAGRFALKGGMILMQAEGVGPVLGRATSDIDVHIPGFDGPMEELEDILRESLSAEMSEDDGVRFDLGTLALSRTRDGAVAGAAVGVVAQVGQVGVKVRADLGFDDRPVFDVAVEEDLPSVLPGLFAPVSVRRVPFSWTLADKVQCLVRHGESTTRLRDYYDMHVILSRGLADPEETADALVRTFGLFDSEMPADADGLHALSDEYARRNAPAWDREIRGRGFAVRMPPLPEVCALLREALEPVIERAHGIAAARSPR